MRSIYYLLLLIFFFSCENKVPALETEVLVVGGGASGVAAAIQAARSGTKVILVEETSWLGGMISAAGVSATDGNHRLPSGIWGEFRQQLYDHYGGAEAVATGWVSNTHFEPHIAKQVWQEMVRAEPNIEVKFGYWPTKVIKQDQDLQGVVFLDSALNELTIKAEVIIEATELGDVLAMAGVEFETGISTAEEPHNDLVQDLTFTAIVKDFGAGADKSIPMPPNYDASEYDCICREVCENPSEDLLDCATVLNYAELPNKKFLLNWPRSGNDYYVNAIPLSREDRAAEYERAKERSLGLLYFLQQEAGYKNLGLAEDEFPTNDLLPLIPYHREARRIKGVLRLETSDLVDPYADYARTYYRDAIAVGDYPLDHHHLELKEVPEENFPPIPSFSVPYGCLIPKKMDGLIVAEKSISVSHIVNGATRLQPCVLLIGQAAGAAAALAVELQQKPRDIPIRRLQQRLLDANCWLLPFIDVPPAHPYFLAIQRIGLSSGLRGKGIPYQWANQTWFYPDSLIQANTWLIAISIYGVKPSAKLTGQSRVSRKEALESLAEFPGSPAKAVFERWQAQLGWKADEEAHLSRAEAAFLLDQAFKPFESGH